MAYGNSDEERGYENRKSLAQTMASGALGAFPPAPQTPREPMVQRRMMELGKIASLLHDAVSQLEARLQSVLAPEPVSGDTAGASAAPKAPGLAQQIQDSAETVAHGISRIHRLIGRLEL